MRRLCGAPAGWNLIHDGADGGDHVDVGHLAVAADVVGFAGSAFFQHQGDGLAVVADVEPVADVESVAIDRERLAVERIEDDERDQLFRKLKWAVIVGAIGGERRQSVGVLVGAHQVIAAGLGGGVGTVGLVGVGLGEGRVGFAERSVDLIGGDVEKAEAGLGLRGKGAVVGERFVEEAKGSDDVGEDELFGADDGAVDVAFGGKVYQRIGLVS